MQDCDNIASIGYLQLNVISQIVYTVQNARWTDTPDSGGEFLYCSRDLASRENGPELHDAMAVFCDFDIAAIYNLKEHESFHGAKHRNTNPARSM